MGVALACWELFLNVSMNITISYAGDLCLFYYVLEFFEAMKSPILIIVSVEIFFSILVLQQVGCCNMQFILHYN